MAAGALAAILLVSVFSHMPAAKAAGVTVIGSSGMLGSGEYRIAGELQNNGGSTVGNVVVSATFLDSSGGFVTSMSADSFIKTLRPGEKSAFALSLADTGIGSRIASYKLDVTSSNAIDKPSTLKVVANNGYYDSTGAYHLVGEVSNTGIITAKSVVVSAAFYDKDGRIEGADSMYTVPAQLSAGSTVPFHFVYDRATRDSIASFSVNTQSDELSSIMDLKPGSQQPLQQSLQAKAPDVGLNLDSQSYHFADTVHVTGNESSLVTGESLVKVELIYPDGSLLNSRQVPLVKNIFFTSFEVFAGPENDGKTFTVKATYAGGSTTSSFKYLGSGTQQPSQEKQDLKKYSAKLFMSATINGQKVMILSLKNPKGSDGTIYGVNIKIDKGSIKSAVGTAGWKAKIDGSTVKFMTSKPVTAGKLGNFKLRVSDAVHTISWSAVDKDGRVIDNNSAAVKARK